MIHGGRIKRFEGHLRGGVILILKTLRSWREFVDFVSHDSVLQGSTFFILKGEKKDY